jgi:putative MATE family efflux protein
MTVRIKNRFKIVNRDEYKRIFALTWPAFIELFLSSLFGAVDLAMVGKLDPAISDAAISSVGMTDQPFFIMIALFAAINVGTTTQVAWSIGAKDHGRAAAVLRQTLMMNLMLGVTLSFVGESLSGAVMGLMSDDATVVGFAADYFRIVCYGLAFQAVNMAITAALRGCGITRIPMIYNLTANALSVLLNYLLIYGNWGFPQMGVKGAAVATTIGRIVGCLIALCFVIKLRTPIKLKLRSKWRLDFKLISEMLSVGLPATGEQFVIQSGLLVFSRIVLTLGPVHYAAHRICININGMAFSVSQAFSLSATALTGQSVGADNYPLAEKLTKCTVKAARAATLALAVIFVFFGRYIAMLYTERQDVLGLTRPLFFFMAAVHFLQSAQMSRAGALRGSGDTMYPLYASIAGIWIFRVGVALLFILVFKWGLIGAWMAFFLDQCMRSIVVKLRF